MFKNKPEILAPVGGKEQLTAAVRCGADAVYLGAKNFNARRNAENFGDMDLKEAVRYCHAYGVKVYVTLNTLVFDYELEGLCATVRETAEAKADAVIVQDFAVIEAVKKICPALPLHASTQMAIHNVEGAMALEKLGFTRVVLAREMTLEEIREVCENTKLEVEVFIHGAHCMSASGNCYLSAILGERSGNRGQCAQGCRLDWQSSQRNHALSLKDMSYLDSLPLLAEAGAASFKIEGRMKRPEYVAAAVTSAKRARDGYKYDKETLKSIFSRSGFTDGYLKGERNGSMFGFRSKDDVTAAPAVFKELQRLYESDKPAAQIDMRFEIKTGSLPSLTVSLQGRSAAVSASQPAEQPIKEPLSRELCERNLKKLGGTPFSAGEIEFSNPDGLTMPLSQINAMRREACEKLSALLEKEEYPLLPFEFENRAAHKPEAGACIRAQFRHISQYSPCFDECEAVSFPLDEILASPEELREIKPAVFASLPSLVYPFDEKKLSGRLRTLKSLGITDVETGNLGTAALAMGLGFTVHGTHALNITNTPALEFCREFGLKDTVLSFELSAKNAAALGGTIKRGMYAYGYLPLMLFRNCPQKGASCAGCGGESVLKDRRGIDFSLLCHKRQYSVLHNSVPLYIGTKRVPSVDFYTLLFTTESKAECENIFKSFISGSDIDGRKTNGLLYRELI